MRYAFVILAALFALVSAIPDCRPAKAASVAPDLTQRCDQTVSCQFCDRNQLSFDFLCCEDGGGWVSAHAVTPLLIYLYFQNVPWTIIAILGFEVIEQLFLVFFEPSGFDPTVYESIMGIVVGDGLTQGGIGLLIGVLWTYIFDWPLLVSTKYRAALLGKRWKRFRYIAVWALHTAAIMVILWKSANGRWVYGLFVNMAVQLLFWWVLHPLWLSTHRENDMLWAPDPKQPDTNVYPEKKRRLFFWLTPVIIIGIQFADWGVRYFANNYFQVWLNEAVIVTALTVLASIVASRRRDWYMLLIWIATYVVALAVMFLVLGQVYENDTCSWLALAFLIAAGLVYIFNEIFQHRARPWNVNFSRRSEAQPMGTAQRVSELKKWLN